MTSDSNACDNVMNDSHLDEKNNKTVKCQLRKTFQRLAVTEENIGMFNTLIKLGLALHMMSETLP